MNEPNTSKHPWDMAYQDFLVARSRYLDAAACFQRLPAGDRSPEGSLVYENLFLATDLSIQALNTLLATPAPDLAGVAVKLQEIHDYLAETAPNQVAGFSKAALAAAKLGDSRTARKWAQRALSWLIDDCGDGADLEYVLTDLRRLSA